MEVLTVTGGRPLLGKIKAAGAKNAMTKLLVASLISDKRCTFFNVPNILDVEITLDMCSAVGMEAFWDKEAGVLEVETKELKTTYIPERFSGSNRIPILMIGALLARSQEEIVVPCLGGDKIGLRPVDFHFHSLRALGARCEMQKKEQETAYFAYAPNGLKGAVISLPYPSVGATENTILAAVTACGVTTIQNAACEPEIIELLLFLQKLGANITINSDRTIEIHGTRHFHEVQHTVIPDRLEVASFGMAAIATEGKVFVEGAKHQHMITFLNKIREIGGGFSVKNTGIEFFYDGPLQGGIHLETDVYPGFSTDWQQPFVVLLTQSHGTSVVHETVYENRFGYVDALSEMGADISLFKQCLGGSQCRFSGHRFPHSVAVKGKTALRGKDIQIPDLRAGFAYVMAALVAKETSSLFGVEFLDRGYSQLTEKLISLGADVERSKNLCFV